MFAMMDRSKAERTLLSAYNALDLGRIFDVVPVECRFTFNKVEHSSARNCTWEVRDDVLEADIYDTDIESGVKMMISTFARTSLFNDDDITIRMGYLPTLILLFYSILLFLFLFSAYFSGMNDTAFMISIFGSAFTPLLLWWYKVSSEKVETAFARRIADALNMEEVQVYSEYGYFISTGHGRNFVIMLVIFEFIFMALAVYCKLYKL